MSIEIDFTYNIDGMFHSVNYYRSETPMNPASMPAATATGITGLTFTDTSAVTGKLYYVRFGSVKNGVEKISAEIEVQTLVEYANTYLRLESDVTDRGTNPKTFTNYGVTFSSGMGVFSGSQHIAANAKSADFNFGAGDFTIEFVFSIPNSGGGYAVDLRNLFGNTNTLVTSDYANLVIVNPSNLSWSNGSVLRTVTMPFVANQVYAVAITRASGVLRIFIDGVKMLEVTDTTNCDGDRFMHVGVARLKDGTYEGRFNGSISRVRITKGVAKYTSGYSITYQK